MRGAVGRATRWIGRLARGEVVKRVGGPARARVIVLFGAVLALNGADTATVGAVAPQLESCAAHRQRQDRIARVGVAAGRRGVHDPGRAPRRPVQADADAGASIVLWSVASLLSAFAGSYGTLLLTRLLLGAVAATAGPAIASLTGDYFPARERGRSTPTSWAARSPAPPSGFIVSSSVASLIDWRAAFVLLAIPGFFLARELWRTVPEPLRGGQSRLEPGVVDLHEAAAAGRIEPGVGVGADGRDAPADDDLAHQAAQKRGVTPNPDRVLTEDPREMPLARAVRYILSVPTNVHLIVSSSLGYFYFSGLSTFALLFVRGHYHVNQATAEVVLAALVGGAMIGTLISGKITDAMVRRGVRRGARLGPGALLSRRRRRCSSRACWAAT